MKSARRGLAALLLSCTFAAPAIAGPDVLIIGTATTTEATASVPVYIRDTSGTPLGMDQTSRIQRIQFRVVFSQPTLIAGCTSQTIPDCAVTFVPGGVLSGKSGKITQLRDAASLTVIGDYVSDLTFTSDVDAPGDEIGHLTISFTGVHTTESDLALQFDPEATKLSDGSTEIETLADGSLALIDGHVGFGSACSSAPQSVNIGWTGSASGCTTGGGSCMTGETIFLRAETPAEPQPCDTAYWSFDDKTVAKGSETTHQFNTSGTHPVRLHVMNRLGKRSAQAQVLTTATPATCTLPTQAQADISFSGSQGCGSGISCQTGETIEFRIFTFGYNFSGCESFLWNFGDGTSSTQQSPSKSYSAAKTYAVRVTISSPSGQQQTFTTTVKVGSGGGNPGSCTVTGCTVSVPDTAASGAVVRFTGSVLPQDCVPDHPTTWTFGDGSSTTIAMTFVDHVYAAPGTYTWTMTTSFCSRTGTITITEPVRRRSVRH